jgi:hypothetical protein
MAQSQPPHPGVALGGVFLSLFGALWLAGASVRYLGTSPAALAAIAAGAAAIAAWGLALFRRRRPVYGFDAAARKRLARSFMVVNAVQWSLIGLLILALNVTGHIAWIVPGVIFIVGVHFVPLARLFRYRGYDATAAALVLVAVLDVIAGAGDRAIAPSLLATGAILWISAIVLLRAMQPRRAAGGMPARAP